MSLPSSSSPRSDVQSNLKNFLCAVTPKVLSRTHSTDMHQSVVNEDDVGEYFFLGDLWHCYDKWSAYGLGTRVVLNNSETVVQYYTPHLSAIQLYTTPTFSKTWNGASVTSNNGNRGLCDMRGTDPLAHLYFQYEESISPYWRAPFTEKVAELGEGFPGINSLRSTDLSPASWMSIVWSPIYHIPRNGKVDDLSTYFLTYHTLSSHFQDSEGSNAVKNVAKDILVSYELDGFLKTKPETNSKKTIELPPFGLSSLKMCGDIWINQEAGDYELLIDLHCAADSWLKQLRVCHGDFDYYKRKNIECGSIFK